LYYFDAEKQNSIKSQNKFEATKVVEIDISGKKWRAYFT